MKGARTGFSDGMKALKVGLLERRQCQCLLNQAVGEELVFCMTYMDFYTPLQKIRADEQAASHKRRNEWKRCERNSDSLRSQMRTNLWIRQDQLCAQLEKPSAKSVV